MCLLCSEICPVFCGKKRFLAAKNGYLNKNRPPKTTVYKVFKKVNKCLNINFLQIFMNKKARRNVV